jgi:hypothetical protein
VRARLHDDARAAATDPKTACEQLAGTSLAATAISLPTTGATLTSAVLVAADVALSLMLSRYGSLPERVYFEDGSIGGREALTAVMRSTA